MADWMEELITVARSQGFVVSQNPSGSWRFVRDGISMTFEAGPHSARRFIRIVQTLEGAGLRFLRAGGLRTPARRARR